MRKPRIVVVGSTNTDMVFRTSRVPEAGETLVGATFAMIAGGKGANQAVAAARLGGKVTFVAKVGADSLGKSAVEGFKRDGIDTRYVAVADVAASGVAAILVDETTGQNRIIVAGGANEQLTVDDVRAASDAISAADIVVCQLEIPLDAVCEALALARRDGVPTILNPAPAHDLPEEIFEMVTYLTPNEIEADQLAFGTRNGGEISPQEAAAQLRRSGAETVIVTLGRVGAYAVTRSRSFMVPGQPVEHVVDTTAAGDCFTGALAVGIGEGQTLEDAIAFANRAAAVSVMRPGAQPSLPTRGEVNLN